MGAESSTAGWGSWQRRWWLVLALLTILGLLAFAPRLSLLVLLALAGVLWLGWVHVEAALRLWAVHRLPATIGVSHVRLEAITLRAARFELRGLEVGNAPGKWNSPYALSIQRLAFTTGGIKGWLSLLGLKRFFRGSFILGFRTRDLETFELYECRLFLEEVKDEELSGVSSSKRSLGSQRSVHRLDSEEGPLSDRPESRPFATDLTSTAGFGMSRMSSSTEAVSEREDGNDHEREVGMSSTPPDGAQKRGTPQASRFASEHARTMPNTGNAPHSTSVRTADGITAGHNNEEQACARAKHHVTSSRDTRFGELIPPPGVRDQVDLDHRMPFPSAEFTPGARARHWAQAIVALLKADAAVNSPAKYEGPDRGSARHVGGGSAVASTLQSDGEHMKARRTRVNAPWFETLWVMVRAKQAKLDRERAQRREHARRELKEWQQRWEVPCDRSSRGSVAEAVSGDAAATVDVEMDVDAGILHSGDDGYGGSSARGEDQARPSRPSRLNVWERSTSRDGPTARRVHEGERVADVRAEMWRMDSSRELDETLAAAEEMLLHSRDPNCATSKLERPGGGFMHGRSRERGAPGSENDGIGEMQKDVGMPSPGNTSGQSRPNAGRKNLLGAQIIGTLRKRMKQVTPSETELELKD